MQQQPAAGPRHDYTREELSALYDQPLTRLIRQAQQTHVRHFPDDEVQLCTLLSVKTGGCAEDCAYCPQSARYQTGLAADKQLDVEAIVASARAAQAGGSTRFCMGAAWRSVPTRGDDFAHLLSAARAVDALGLEVCMTLGMLNREQAQALKAAGVHAYNHNLDTSPEFYGSIITTRTYEDRMATLRHVREAGMTVCCGGIVGLGESRADRVGLLQQLNHMQPHPESVPINLLVRVAGTPLAQAADLDIFELVRTIAVARLVLPQSRVRLSAGRTQMTDEAQALCLLAGANSIFTGEKLLTTPNPGISHDRAFLARLGLRPVAAAAE